MTSTIAATPISGFKAVQMPAPFTEHQVAALMRVARPRGTFVRRPTPDEPLYLPPPPMTDYRRWVYGTLGPGWVASSRLSDCDTFDGLLPGLHVVGPHRREDSRVILLSTDGPVDTEGDLWASLVKAEPTLTVVASSLAGTWAFLARYSTSYLR